MKANLLRSIEDWRDGWPIDGAPLAEALERFAGAIDIATCEFENIPAESVSWVS